MTFRARQGSNRSRSWDDRTRRSMLMNLGFGITVAVAVLLLAVAVAAAWYDGHLAAAATVNGQTITKDAFHRQEAVNAFRIDYERRRVRTLLSAGHLWSSDATARISSLDTQLSQAPTIAIGQLIDGTILLDLAAKQGVAVTDADVDQGLTTEATTPELRHIWMIEVSPTLATGETTATDAEKAAAKAKADQLLTSLKAGGDWVTIAKASSSDASKAQGGDIGFIDKNSSLDAPFVEALTTSIPNTPSDVIEGADGNYRIGRVTEIIAASTDAAYAESVKAAGISMDDVRSAIRLDVAHQKLSDAIVNQALAVGPQRKVAEIYMQESASEVGPSAIRVRHILYSPNHDPAKASTVAATDPAWNAAKVLADATYAKLQADPTQFDAIARAESDESAARTSGGKLPYFSTDDQIDAAFAAVIFKAGLKPGDLLPPVRSAFGWHVIQVMHGPTDLAWATQLVAKATSADAFATLARDNSDNADAAKGGDMGWVGKFQLNKPLEEAIFAAPIGKVSQPVTLPGDGTYLFFVSQEVTKAPDASQTAVIKASAFTTWYTLQKGGYTVTQDPAIAASVTS